MSPITPKTSSMSFRLSCSLLPATTDFRITSISVAFAQDDAFGFETNVMFEWSGASAVDGNVDWIAHAHAVL